MEHDLNIQMIFGIKIYNFDPYNAFLAIATIYPSDFRLVLCSRDTGVNVWALMQFVCSSAGKEFPNTFDSLVKKICRYLFHVLAHIYWSHYKETVAMDLHGHINTLYTHFMVFIREFNLMDPKETSMMDDLTEALCTPLPPQPQNHVTERWVRRRSVSDLPSRAGVQKDCWDSQTFTLPEHCSL